MSKKVSINDCTDEIKEDFTGTYILLSIEEYNKIVRQLNILTIFVSEIQPKDNKLNVLMKHSLQAIE